MPSKAEKAMKKKKKADEQAFYISFIQEYRDMEPIWNITHPQYHQRTAREACVQELLKIYRQWDANKDATRTDLMGKLNTLKSTYRTERKKVITSERSGTGTDDLYVSKWYLYEAFDKFLRDSSCAEPATHHVSSMNLEETDTAANIIILDEANDDVQMLDNDDDVQEREDTPARSITTTTTSTSGSSNRKRSHGKTDDAERDLLQLACERLQKVTERPTSTPAAPPDEYAVQAATWANELRNMSSGQQVLAKKFINDILFEGRMNTLQRDSLVLTTIVNVEDVNEVTY